MAHGLRRGALGAGRLAAGLLLVAAGLFLVAAGVRPDPARVSPHAAGYVNADRPGIANHNSPAAAVDPTRPSVIVVADRIDSPRFSCSISLSTTGGETWRPLALPLPPEAPNCFWPDVAFLGDGRLVVLFTASGGRFNQPLGVWLQRFDAEQPDGPAVKVTGSEAFHAHLGVDGRRVLVAWVQTPPENAERPLGFAPGPNPIMVSRSEDGGATFSSPVRVSEPGARVAHPSVVVGAAGTVLVGALDYGDDVADYEGTHEGQAGPPPPAHWRVLAWRSTDGGATFGRTEVVSDLLVIPQRVVIDLAPGPSLAADRAHRFFYAAWDAGRGDGRDVFVARSSDDGRTWSRPVAVGPRPRSQLLPALDVAPDGRVDVVFYDRSRDPRDVLAEVRVGSSWDNGRSFTTKVASDRRIDTRIGQGTIQAIAQLGNQLAVLSRPSRFLAFWPEVGKEHVQDLAAATVDVHQRGDRSWLLVIVGATVAAAGTALSLRRAPESPALPAPVRSPVR